MRWRSPEANVDRSIGPIALLLVAVLVPAAFLLWFMSETVTTQAAAARQRVIEAYRGQLRLIRPRIDAYWRTHASRLTTTGSPEALFAHLVLEHDADGVVLLNEDGSVAYPQCCELTARAVSVDRQLLAIQDVAPSDPPFQARVDALASRLNDYDDPLPSSQRLFLMGELRALSPNVRLPTEAALRLSTEMLESGAPAAVSDGFSPTAIAEVWSLASPDRRVIALYRTGRIESMMHDVLHQVVVDGVRFIALPPGDGTDAEAIAAGPTLPGWQLTFALLDTTALDDAARRHAMSYVWIGFAGIVLMAVLGATAGGTFRRHLRLARLKTDLVAAVSHELRTPLASMRVLVDGLLADRELDPAKTREYLSMMATENARLSRLLDNFLTFSRLERRRHQFVFRDVHPLAIVESALEAVQERVPPGCVLRVDIAPDVPAVMADADALGTAVVNLLDNALKYTHADKRILVRIRRDGRFVVFDVEDNGIGIPVREQRRIFRRFYRVDQRLASETSGVGLGLSIVDLIVRAHGGTVTVRSEAAAGSTFTLRVPCSPHGAPAGAEVSA
jgi:signal transduction histidine kinase